MKKDVLEGKNTDVAAQNQVTEESTTSIRKAAEVKIALPFRREKGGSVTERHVTEEDTL